MSERRIRERRTDRPSHAPTQDWRHDEVDDPVARELRRLRHQRSVLAGLARDSLAGVPLTELFDRTCHWLAVTLDVPVAVMLERRGERGVVRAAHGLGPRPAGLPSAPMDADHPLHGVTLTELVTIEDGPVESFMGLVPDVLRSCVAVGIEGGGFTGVVAVYDVQPRGWEPDVAPFLQLVATVLSGAAQRAQAERERKVVVETVPVGITYSDHTGRLTFANPAAERILGLDRSAIEARDYDHPDWRPTTSAGGPVPAHELPIARVVRTGQPVDDVDLVISQPGGQRRVLSVNAAPVRGPGGQLAGVVTSFCDVTEERASRRRIHEDQQQLHTLLEQIPGIVWTASPSGTITSWRGALTDELDLEIEPVGADAHTVLSDSSYAALVDAVEGTLEHGSTSAAVRFRERGRWWRSTVRPVLDETGTVVSLVGLTLDVTSEHQAVEARRASEERLRGLFDNTLDAIVLTNDSGRCIDANPAACRLTGYQRDQLVGMAVSALVPASEVDSPGAPFARLGRARGECQVRRADSQLVDTEFAAVGDVVPGVHLTSLHDITDRKLTERALQRSEERFRRLAENAQDIIFRLRLGDDVAFEYISPSVRAVLGHSPEQLYRDPTSMLGLLHPDDRERFAALDLASATRLPSPQVMRWRRADGRYIWVEERHRYETDAAGEIVAVEGIARDVTEQVEAESKLVDALELERDATERLRHVNELKDAFLTAVSHELRTPLTALVGFSELLRRAHDDLQTDRVELLLDRIAGNARRLDQLLDELLDVDRLTHGLVEPDRRRVDVGGLTLAVLEAIDTRDHALVIKVDRVVVDVDPPKFERVVEHLISNAIVHTPTGTRVWVRCQAHHGGVLLTVEDDGPGVPRKLRDAILEPFTLGDSEAARVGGVGIGLSLVAGYAELHGGKLSVHERDGGGASFHVWLPASADAVATA